MGSLADLIEDLEIGDQRLVDAFREVKREEFVPERVRGQAEEDRPLPIPHGQVTTQPSLTARMIAALHLQPTDSVLEVGTGHGFQTALLATLTDRVVTIERFSGLSESARQNLEAAGIDNVELRVGDGSQGAPHRAPFDAILVSAAYPHVPEPLAAQLEEGGRLVQPIGPGGSEDVTLFVKRQGRLERSAVVVAAHFVPLVAEDDPV